MLSDVFLVALVKILRVELIAGHGLTLGLSNADVIEIQHWTLWSVLLPEKTSFTAAMIEQEFLQHTTNGVQCFADCKLKNEEFLF